MIRHSLPNYLKHGGIKRLEHWHLYTDVCNMPEDRAVYHGVIRRPITVVGGFQFNAMPKWELWWKSCD